MRNRGSDTICGLFSSSTEGALLQFEKLYATICGITGIDSLAFQRASYLYGQVFEYIYARNVMIVSVVLDAVQQEDLIPDAFIDAAEDWYPDKAVMSQPGVR